MGRGIYCIFIFILVSFLSLFYFQRQDYAHDELKALLNVFCIPMSSHVVFDKILWHYIDKAYLLPIFSVSFLNSYSFRAHGMITSNISFFFIFPRMQYIYGVYS